MTVSVFVPERVVSIEVAKPDHVFPRSTRGGFFCFFNVIPELIYRGIRSTIIIDIENRDGRVTVFNFYG